MIGVILEGCYQHWIVMICCNALLLSYAENHDGVDVNLIALPLWVFCTQLNPFLLIRYFRGKILRGARPSILDCCVLSVLAQNQMCPNIAWIESKLIIHNRHQINTCDLINYVIVYGHWVCSRQHLSRHGGFSKRFSGKPLHFLDVKMLMVWKKQHKTDIKFLRKFVHFLLKLLVLIFSFRGKKWKGGLIIAESLSSELCDLPLHICKDVDKGNAAQKIKAAFGLLIFSHYDVLKYFPRSIFSSSLHSCTISSTWLQNGRGHSFLFF